MRWQVLTLREQTPAQGDVSQRWQVPEDLQRQFEPAKVRLFAQLGVLAIHADDDCRTDFTALPGVVRVTLPQSLEGLGDRWYVNLLAAWDSLIGHAGDFDGTVVNMSLGPPPGEPNEFHRFEPMQRAFRAAYRAGVVTVLAAGNEGEEGDDSLTRWARSPWVIKVGASDATGRKVAAYSSRGVPGRPRSGPTVTAVGERDLSGLEFGTSFAAPAVTDIVLLFQAFVARLWQLGGQPVASVRPLFSRRLARCVAQAARPMQAAPHVGGAGFVNWPLAVDYLRGLTPERVRLQFPAGDWLTGDLLSAAQAELDDPITLIYQRRLARIAIDTTYEWNRPAFVPGLLRMKDCFMLRIADAFTIQQDFDTAITQCQSALFIEISIVPHRQRARALVVSAQGEPGTFPTIGAAVAAAAPWDVITVRPGRYEETLVLRSGVTITGEAGAVVRPRSGIPVALAGCRDVALVNLEFVANDPRREAVLIANCSNVVFQQCRLRSATGNGVLVCFSHRLLFVDNEITGGINAGYVAFSSECHFQTSRLTGTSIGLLLYAASTQVVRCEVTAARLDAVFFIAPDAPWTRQQAVRVLVYPMGETVATAADVAPDKARLSTVAGALARSQYALQVQDSTFRAANVAIAATRFDSVLADGCRVVETPVQFALLRGSHPLPMVLPDRPSVDAALAQIQKSLNGIQHLPVEG